jgi:conserved oligomeric Golgi complex subunit 6
LRLSLDTADPSLTPPQVLLTHVQDIRAILALHTAEADTDSEDETDGVSGNGSGGDGATIERALDALVDPAVRMCVSAAEEKDTVLRRRAGPGGTAHAWDRPVFVLNCLTYLADTLSPHPCATRKHVELGNTIEARVRELIEEHVRISRFPFSSSLMRLPP